MQTRRDSDLVATNSNLKMKDLQTKSSDGDLLNTSLDDNWNFENKCLLHNQQFSEEVQDTEISQNNIINERICKYCSHVKSKNLNSQNCKKSGDWKFEDNWVEYSMSKNIQQTKNVDWKFRNPYSISDFDRLNYWNSQSFNSETQDNSKKDNIENNYLYIFREYLANYQECSGVPRTEYSFPALIRIMGQATGRSLLAILYMMVNILPVIEIFLHILRFILDRTISIRKTSDTHQKIIQYPLLGLQLLSIYVCLIFIFGFIVLPILHMIISIIAKITLYD